MPKIAAKVDVKKALTTFERSLKRAETETGGVDMAKLKQELKAKAPDKQTAAIFDRCVKTLEEKFAKVTGTASCGSTLSAPKALTARQATSVLNALIEAKSKGLDKIDTDKNGKISRDEALTPHGDKLADRLAHAAALGATATARRPSTGSTGSTGSSTGGSVGCGGSSGSAGGGSSRGSSVGC